jgi:hypothetical protein
MKLPSALDMGLVMVVLIGLQAFFANVPESQGWWAPAIAAALLSATKVLEVWLVTPKPATASRVVLPAPEADEEDSPPEKLLPPAGAAAGVVAGDGLLLGAAEQLFADKRAKAILAVSDELIATWQLSSGAQIVEVRVPANTGWLKRWLND